MKNLLIIRGTQTTINRCETVIRSGLDLSKLKDTHGVLLIVQPKKDRTVTENTQCIILSWALVTKLDMKEDKQPIKIGWYDNDMEQFMSDELPDDLVKHIDAHKGPSFWEFDEADFEDCNHYTTDVASADGDINEVFEPPVVRNMLVITTSLITLGRVNYPNVNLPEGELHKLRQTYGLLLVSKRPDAGKNMCYVYHMPDAHVLTRAPASISFCGADKQVVDIKTIPAALIAQALACEGDSFFYDMPQPVASLRDYGTDFEGDAEVIPQDQSPLYMYSVETILEHLSERLNSKITITR